MVQAGQSLRAVASLPRRPFDHREGIGPSQGSQRREIRADKAPADILHVGLGQGFGKRGAPGHQGVACVVGGCHAELVPVVAHRSTLGFDRLTRRPSVASLRRAASRLITTKLPFDTCPSFVESLTEHFQRVGSEGGGVYEAARFHGVQTSICGTRSDCAGVRLKPSECSIATVHCCIFARDIRRGDPAFASTDQPRADWRTNACLTAQVASLHRAGTGQRSRWTVAFLSLSAWRHTDCVRALLSLVPSRFRNSLGWFGILGPSQDASCHEQE